MCNLLPGSIADIWQAEKPDFDAAAHGLRWLRREEQARITDLPD